MPVDLKQIAIENVRRYGTDIDKYGPVLLAHLYSDKTHFVFELMQNAEDAGAKKVSFRLFVDRLEFEHDGRPFNDADVRGICGLVTGTKSDDLTKIGRFGIGFKSVFAYTNSPRIHCQDQDFCIENYVLPSATQPRDIPAGKTCFVFPFDHDAVSPKEAESEILDRLSDFGIRTLLFLKNVKKVTCSHGDEELGVFSRSDRGGANVRHATLTSSMYDFVDKEKWLVFRAAVRVPKGTDAPKSPVFVEIAYSVRKDKAGNEHIGRISESPLVVFFPTEKETDLGFLVQGPYVTTPARDNVPEKDPWNLHLVAETATLAQSSLESLKSMGLLEAQTLEAMPIDDSDFYETDMFYPVSESIRKALWTEDLIPAQRGGYIAGEKGKLAKNVDIPRLFTPARLKELLKLSTMPKWISTDISSRKTPRLYGYLTSDLSEYSAKGRKESTSVGTEISVDVIVQNITASFMEGQPESWLKEFYSFLGTVDHFHDDLKVKPIVLTQCGRFVCAYDENGAPNVFLPSRSSASYTIVKRSLAKIPEVKVLLDGLGIHAPDMTSQILKHVLPKYDPKSGTRVRQKEHREDMEAIVAALGSDSDLVFELEEALRVTPFLRARNAKTGRLAYKVPSDTYIRTKELELFFSGNSDAWFIEEDRDIDWADLDARDCIPLENANPSRDGHVKLTYTGREYQRGLDGFDPNCKIEGLERALITPSFELAMFVWNELLIPNARSVAGVVQTASSYSFRSPRETTTVSPMGKIVRESRWIPGKDGKHLKPSEIAADDLPMGFTRDEFLIEQLDMRPASIGVLAKETGISVDVLDQLRADPNIFQDFLEWRESQAYKNEEPAEVDDADSDEDWSLESGEGTDTESRRQVAFGFKRYGQSDSDQERVEPKNEPVNYSHLLTNDFVRPSKVDIGDTLGLDDLEESSKIKNIGRRTQKLGENIREKIANSPTEEKRRRVTQRSILEALDPMVRQALFEWYDGRCQICDYSWVDRAGRPYFVAAHLVERKHAAWLNDPANALCLCADHFAKWHHATREIETPLQDQISDFHFGGTENGDSPSLRVRLCGEDCTLKYAEPHALALKVLLDEASDSKKG